MAGSKLGKGGRGKRLVAELSIPFVVYVNRLLRTLGLKTSYHEEVKWALYAEVQGVQQPQSDACEDCFTLHHRAFEFLSWPCGGLPRKMSKNDDKTGKVAQESVQAETSPPKLMKAHQVRLYPVDLSNSLLWPENAKESSLISSTSNLGANIPISPQQHKSKLFVLVIAKIDTLLPDLNQEVTLRG
eukprot:3545194-Amphidinium_carterae.6